MYRFILFFFCFCWLGAGIVQAAETYTLSQAVARAMKANPSVEAKKLAMEQAKMNVGVAQSYFWPRLSLVSSTNRMENFENVQTSSTDDNSLFTWNMRRNLTIRENTRTS